MVWKPLNPRNDPKSVLFKDLNGGTIKVEIDLNRLKRAPADYVKINETLYPGQIKYIEEVASKSGCMVENKKIMAEKFDVKHNLYTVSCKGGDVKIKCSTRRGQWVGNVICRPL